MCSPWWLPGVIQIKPSVFETVMKSIERFLRSFTVDECNYNTIYGFQLQLISPRCPRRKKSQRIKSDQSGAAKTKIQQPITLILIRVFEILIVPILYHCTLYLVPCFIFIVPCSFLSVDFVEERFQYEQFIAYQQRISFSRYSFFHTISRNELKQYYTYVSWNKVSFMSSFAIPGRRNGKFEHFFESR